MVTILKTPSKTDIARVMSALGQRNRGRKKTMSPEAIAQRREAAKKSALARKALVPSPAPKRGVPARVTGLTSTISPISRPNREAPSH